MADAIGLEKVAGVLLKSGLRFREQEPDEKIETTALIKQRMAKVVSVHAQLGTKHFLRSDLAPHEICKAKDGVFLGRARGLPLVDQVRMQFDKFARVFAWDCGTRGENAVFLCVGAPALWQTRNDINELIPMVI